MTEQDQVRAALEGLRELYLIDGDQILFVIDAGYADAPIADIFSDYPHDIVRIPKVERPGQNFVFDESLMIGKTVAWLIASASISHSGPSKKMIDAGMYMISNPGITEDWAAIMHPDNRAVCERRGKALLRLIGGDVAGTIHITDQFGTDLTLKVPKGNWMEEYGVRNPGDLGTNGPFGELCSAPYWAEGTYVMRPGDFLTNPINKLHGQVTLVIKNNMVIDIQGGVEVLGGVAAKELIEMLQAGKFGLAYSLGEFAIQLNPGKPKELLRSVIAEKIAGGMHIAIGSNHLLVQPDCPEKDKFPLGAYNAGVHIDCITFGKTITFIREDGSSVVLVKDGQLQVD